MTERAVDKRTQAALLDSQRQVLERIANGAPLHQSLETLVRLIEEHARDMRCAVLLTDSTGKRLQFIAAPHIPEDYKKGIQPYLRIAPEMGSCGTAAFLHEPVYARDTRTDARWKHCSEVAVRNGFLAVWSTPIVGDDNAVLGTFAMYYDKPRLPSAGHIQLIDMAVQMARVAIEAQRRDEALRLVEVRLRSVIDTIPAAVWSAEPSGSVDYVNQRWLDFVGMPRKEFDERGWKAVVHPDDLETSRKSWRHALVSGEPFGIEHRVRRADGEYRWILAHGTPLRDDAGRIVKWYGTAIDIEDRKRVEDALRQSEDRLRHVIDAIPAIVWSGLPDGSIDFVNDRWMAYTGLRFEDALGDGWTATLHPDDRRRMMDYWRSTLASGEPGEIELRVRGADGKYRWFLARHVPVRGASGAITRWYGTGTDIEERKVAEETLRRNQTFFVSEAQRIGRFLGPGAQVRPRDPQASGVIPAAEGRRIGDETSHAERQAVESLTPKERAIVRLITEGKSNAQVAKSLHLSPRTVETYRGRLMQKLQIEDMPALVKLAIRQGLTSVQ
jgi:PAS domain S-box-containing protein